MKSFDEIASILFYGTEEDMYQISCPECGGNVFYDATMGDSMRIQCIECSSRVSMGKLAEIPNCIHIFGVKHVLSNAN